MAQMNADERRKNAKTFRPSLGSADKKGEHHGRKKMVATLRYRSATQAI